MSDIYTIDFEPSKLSHRQDELGLNPSKRLEMT